MISIPSAHKAAIRERPAVLNKKLVFSLIGGDTLTVNNANIWQGSLTIEDTVCSTGAFEIGSTHVNQMTVSLYGAGQSAISDAVFSINSEGHLILNGETVSYDDIYRNINFNDAKVEVYLASPGYDYFLKGTYTVVSATHNDNIIEITAYDYMDKFSRSYSLSTRTYPCTLKQIVAEACTFCGVTDDTGNFAHYNQQISTKPDTDTLTFREVIGYVAQIAGYNARMSVDGKLQFKQFNLGGFGTSGAYHTIDEIYSCRIDSDIINITGIHVDEENAVTETDSEGITTTSLVTTGYDAGTDGYVLSISGNPLIKGGLGQNVATWLFSAYGNKPFRIGNVTHSSDPTIEASDIMQVTDRHDTYNMLVSETRFDGSEAQSTSSNATSPRSTEATQYSNIDKIKTVASEAHLVALAAQGYANQAQRSANQAQASADSAATAAQTAWNHADDANTAAQTAWDHADDALTAAGNAQTSANAAATAASNAQTSANNAQTSANDAQAQAELATGYAGNALIQLSEVEQVANILNWIAQHGTYSKTSDTAIVQNKNYYTKSGNVYTLVTEPDVADIGNYYELHIDEAIANYVSTHLALTNDGLYVIKGVNDYRLRITNNAFQVIDANGTAVATYGTSISFDPTKEYTIGNSSNYLKFFDSDGDGIADSIAIIANQILLGNKDVGDAIDSLENMEIGGKNKLTGTNSTTQLTATGYWADRTWRKAGGGTGTITHVDITDCPDKSVVNGWQIDVTSVSSTAFGQSVAIGQNRVKIIGEQQYTISCYAKGSGQLYMFCGISSYSGTRIDVTSEWKRYSYTFTARTTSAYVADTGANVFFGASVDGASVTVCGMQLESGNKASAWNPAPEDFDADIDDAKKTATNYMSADSTGVMVADLVNGTQTPSTATGNNVLITSTDVQVRSGQTALASFGSSTFHVGTDANTKIQYTTSDGLKIGKSISISPTGATQLGDFYVDAPTSQGGLGFLRFIDSDGHIFTLGQDVEEPVLLGDPLYFLSVYSGTPISPTTLTCGIRADGAIATSTYIVPKANKGGSIGSLKGGFDSYNDHIWGNAYIDTINVRKLIIDEHLMLAPCRLGATSSGTFTLPVTNGDFLVFTFHNSTASLNGIWAVCLGANSVFKLAGGSTVTITASDNKNITVTTQSGTVRVGYLYISI